MKKSEIEIFIVRCYAMYPRKMARQKGIEKLKKQLKTEAHCRDFFTALTRFIAYHEKNATEPAFIPYFATFVNSWVDWLEEDTGRCIEFTKKFDDLFSKVKAEVTHETDTGKLSGGDEHVDKLLRGSGEV